MEKLSALRSDEYLRERADRADVGRAKRILARAGKGKAAVPGDEMATRFQDPRVWLGSFGKDVLVECPGCHHCANIHFANSSRPIVRTAVCTNCGYSNRTDVGGLPTYSYANDWNRRLGLWLQTPCAGRVLWALNKDHLEFLRSFVGAHLRERRPNEYGWSNQSMAGRLPRWMTSAKNRDEVLRCVRRLDDRLAES